MKGNEQDCRANALLGEGAVGEGCRYGSATTTWCDRGKIIMRYDTPGAVVHIRLQFRSPFPFVYMYMYMRASPRYCASRLLIAAFFTRVYILGRACFDPTSLPVDES